MHERSARLVEELVAARDALFSALDRVPPARLGEHGVIGEWSPQELVAHVGYWAGRAVEIIQAAEGGTLDEHGVGEPSVDEVNAAVARVARESDPATVRSRERAAFDVLVERLGRMDPALLDLQLPNGATVERRLRDDGAGHYRDHATELAEIVARG